MTAKQSMQELQSQREFFLDLAGKFEDINNLRYLLIPSAITYDSDKVMTSPMDRMSELLSEVADLESELLKDLRDMRDRRDKAIDCISRMKNKTYAGLIYLYYIELHSWAETAEMLGVTKSQAFYTLKPRAFEDYAKCL